MKVKLLYVCECNLKFEHFLACSCDERNNYYFTAKHTSSFQFPEISELFDTKKGYKITQKLYYKWNLDLQMTQNNIWSKLEARCRREFGLWIIHHYKNIYFKKIVIIKIVYHISHTVYFTAFMHNNESSLLID